MPYSFSLLAAVAVLVCAPDWSPPLVEKIEGPDDRDCSSGGCVDLVIAVDTSASAAASVDEVDEPIVGSLFSPEAGPSSRLWVSLEGLEGAVDRLDSRRVAVMLLAFAGDPHQKHPAVWTESALTNDPSAVAAAAARVRSREPAGFSCHACAVREGANALRTVSRDRACPLLILLTDATPTLPSTPADSPDFEAANREAVAESLRKAWLRNSMVIFVGQGEPEATAEFARLVANAGSRVARARDSAEVAAAIQGAVDSCESL